MSRFDTRPHSIDAERAKHPTYKHTCYWGVILNEAKQPIFRIGTYRKKEDALQAVRDRMEMATAEWLNRKAFDQKTVAERQWSKPKLAPKPQIPCDVGLFGDEHLQLDLVEMLQDPDPQ